MAKPLISDISDTAFWVATYRAQETERSDALFRDPLARRLVGERGEKIAAGMIGSKYTKWSVVTRTVVIDAFIRDLVVTGIDTVINLGAGLDTRPYRMDLPPSLRWIEVDYPHIIEFKNERLTQETPQCKLERIGLDLADPAARTQLFAKLGSESKNALILTEGVVIYLNLEQAAALAEDLHRQPSFRYWIVDYHSPQVLQYMKTKKRQRQMKNSPFQFDPGNWFEFFKEHHWQASDVRYLVDESEKVGRAVPMPWWVPILRFFLRLAPKNRDAARKFAAYVLLEPMEN